MRTSSPVGTCRLLISDWPPGYWNFHIHCRPMASMVSAPAGGLRCLRKICAAQTKKIRVSMNGMIIQLSSILMLRPSRCERSAATPRR